MIQRLINALSNNYIQNFLNDPKYFPMLLKGGYEDFFSMVLFLNGFTNNNDLTAQYVFDKNRIDIAAFNNNNLVQIIEFGHQFSLQFDSTSGLNNFKQKQEEEDNCLLKLRIYTQSK